MGVFAIWLNKDNRIDKCFYRTCRTKAMRKVSPTSKKLNRRILQMRMKKSMKSLLKRVLWMRNCKKMKRTERRKTIFWTDNRNTKERRMWVFTESRSMSKIWSHMKTKGTRRKTNNFNNRKGILPKNQGAISSSRLMMRVMTSSMISSITSAK